MLVLSVSRLGGSALHAGQLRGQRKVTAVLRLLGREIERNWRGGQPVASTKVFRIPGVGYRLHTSLLQSFYIKLVFLMLLTSKLTQTAV
jgi:hypothetical protein